MCCCPDIKVKYIGQDEERWTTNQVYQVLAIDGAAGIRIVLYSDTTNNLHVEALNADWELVSVSHPSETQLHP